MKFEALRCPACGAAISMDIKDSKTLFCPLCGSQFSVDNGDRTYTYSFNERYTNDAEVERERRLDRESERKHKESNHAMIWLLLLFAIGAVYLYFSNIQDEKFAQEARSSGMIQVGLDHYELEGKNYKGVESQLEAAGFTNIVTVDLQEAGLFSSKTNKVESVSIDGDSSFYSSDYFYPYAKIIISYY